MWRENLRRLIRDFGNNNMKAVSIEAGLGATAVRDILTERVKEPSVETLGKIAAALGVPVGLILGDDTSGNRQVRYVRVIGEVAAGYWRDISHNTFEEYEVPIPVDPKWPHDSVFALQVRGNSINRRARDGDWVICLKCESAPRPYQSGDWVVVEQWDGDKIETTIKMAKWNSGDWELWPDSSDAQFKAPIQLNNLREGVDVKVVAFVLGFHSPGTQF